jgi:phosphate transport system permease protein
MEVAGPYDRAKALNAFKLGDVTFYWITRASAISVLLILGGIILSLIVGAWPAMKQYGPAFLWTQRWAPSADPPVLGALGPMYGTLVTSFIAMLIAIPVGLGIAIFLTELCPLWLRRPIGIAIELLAGIPSIIYGMWGFFVLGPFLAYTFQPFMIRLFGGVPVLGAIFAGPPSYLSLFNAALILAIMVLPFITAISVDVFKTVPPVLKEAAYGVGCTTWEVVRNVVIPYTRVGVIGGIMLALGRALGETMAVTFIIGNSFRISSSIFAPGTTISAAIASEFAESDGLHQSALILLGLLLFVLTFMVLSAARLMLLRLERKRGTEMNPIYKSRRRNDLIIRGLCYGAALFGVTWLALILFTLFFNGFSGLNLEVFTQNTPPPGSNQGGLLNAITGSIIMTAIGVGIGAPLGLFAGTYLAEYGRNGHLTSVIRFINDILLSAPSIIIGLFIYGAIVVPMGGFSALAGSLALAVIVIPVVVRTTEDMLLLVPNPLREAASALGLPRSLVIRRIAYRAARSGLITGVLLATARVAGETAPLLFTALSNQFFSLNLTKTMANLPVTINNFVQSPYAYWKQLAWSGALIITLTVLALNIGARILGAERTAK